jgi:hypothetical protein
VKPKVLYLSVNDGSDTRINKEVKTLAQYADIIYCGIGKTQERAFVKDFCAEFHVTQGSHSNPLVFARYYVSALALLLKYKFHSIHIINENLLLLFLPIVWLSKARVVVDVFDSIFLRLGPDKYRWLQKLSYGVPASVIVTDDNRRELLPKGYEQKVAVVENYPYRVIERYDKAAKEGELIVFYNGSMSATRGTDILLEMLPFAPDLRIWMAGWIYDEGTKVLSEHPQVTFYGVVSQQESLKLAAQSDYILSVYAPIHANNINASPNKIYDAIQARTPVIINGEVLVSKWVTDNNLGYVMPTFEVSDYDELYSNLQKNKSSYTFSEALSQAHTWEAVEGKLIKAHKLN